VTVLDDAERRFFVMGAEAHLRVLGPGATALLARAEARLAELEACWSRFLPGSDLSRVNAAAGQPVTVQPETAELVELALAAWALTDGRFDPTVLPALVAAGYDRSFALLAARGPAGAPGPAQPAPGCAAVEVRAGDRTVHVPPGVQLDLGGIGKGRGADLVAAELLAQGATGACVNLGGDVRVVGSPPAASPSAEVDEVDEVGKTGWVDEVGQAWTIAVEHPLEPAPIVTLALASGAVATSTTSYRRWGEDAHHLIDPATGRPARTDLLAVTVVAAEAAWAEVVAKAALLAGFDAAGRVIGDLGLTGLLVDTQGDAWTLPGLEELLA
jgi:thiamine biosynthesis lipoprotein